MARIVVHQRGLAQIEALPKLEQMLRSEASKIARRANATLRRNQPYPDYDVGFSRRRGKPRAAVFTRSNHAKRHDREENTLIRVLGGGGR